MHISHKAVDPPGEAKAALDIFLDFACRMAFKDKNGRELLPWKSPEEVFNAWKLVSASRPCDYSGMSYDKLTGGSGIQWPCNGQYPQGKERLFADGVFFTNIDYCESFGHDLETGALFSAQYYSQLNPAGRAILKACHYLPSYEMPNADIIPASTRSRSQRVPLSHQDKDGEDSPPRILPRAACPDIRQGRQNIQRKRWRNGDC